jgi:hypothetical protein
VEVPSVSHPLDSGGGQHPDVLHQTSQGGLVLGEAVAVRVDAHNV